MPHEHPPQTLLANAEQIRARHTRTLVGVMGGAFAESLPRIVPIVVQLLIAWGLTMGVVVDFFQEIAANDNAVDIDDVTDRHCGVCGHTCALTLPMLNYCGCWITMFTGGGCSCAWCV